MSSRKGLFLVFLLLTVVLLIVGCDNDSERIIEKVTLTMELSGSGEVSPTEGETECEKGAAVNISASPDEGWQFKEWIGDVGETGNTETIVLMDKDKTVRAVFEEEADPTDVESLVFDIGSLQTDFNPQITEYTLTVGDEVDSIEIIAALADENASMTINGDSVEGGSSKTITLNDPGQTSTVTIVVTAENGDTKTYTITIERETVSVSGVLITQDDQQLTVGEALQLSAEIQPANATNKNINWSSDNTSAATVNSDGLVTAVSTFETEAERTAVITVTTEDGGFTDTITVEVTPPYIVSISDVDDIAVDFGISELDAIDTLAGSTTITDSTDTEYTVDLIWTIANYNGNEAGIYTATGTFNLPAGVIQSDPDKTLEVTAYVTVGNPDIYTVTFDNTTGDTEAEPQTVGVLEGQSLETLPVEPTKDLYNFVEWNTQEDGSGDTFTADTIVTGDMTVYAQWEKIVIESFELTATSAGIYNEDILEIHFAITGTGNTPISYSEAVSSYNLDPAVSTISFHNEDKSDINTFSLDQLIIDEDDSLIITFEELAIDYIYFPPVHTGITVELIPTEDQWEKVTDTDSFPSAALDHFYAELVNMFIIGYMGEVESYWAVGKPGANVVFDTQCFIDWFMQEVLLGAISVSLAESSNTDIVDETGLVTDDPQYIGGSSVLEFLITVGTITESDNFRSDPVTFTFYGIDAENSYANLLTEGTKNAGTAFEVLVSIKDIYAELMLDDSYGIKIVSSIEGIVVDEDITINGGIVNLPVTLDQIGYHELIITVDGVEIASGLGVNIVDDAVVTPEATDYIYGSGSGLDITLNPNGRTLSSINDGSSDLEEGTAYTVSNNVYTILSSYLDGKGLGELLLTFDMNEGVDPAATITIIEEINSASVNITAPVVGGAPEDTAAVEAATADTDYTVTDISWNEELTADGKFKAGTEYTAIVELTAKSYRRFQEESFVPTVSGSSTVGDTSTIDTGIGNTIEFTVRFPATDPLTVTDIELVNQPAKLSYVEGSDDILELDGMVITETYNDGTTGTVNFNDGTADGYTASPADGMRLLEEEHHESPVTVTHTDSGCTAVTANLSVIGEISSVELTMTAPAAGGIPENSEIVEGRTSNLYFTVTSVDWGTNLTADGKFKAETSYTATVVLTSKNNKLFSYDQFRPVVNSADVVGLTTTTGTGVGNTVEFDVHFDETEPLEVVGISVTTQPIKMSYNENESLELNGMKIEETYNDSTTRDVYFYSGTTAGYTASPANGAPLALSHDNSPVTVTHVESGQTAVTIPLTIAALTYTIELDKESEDLGTHTPDYNGEEEVFIVPKTSRTGTGDISNITAELTGENPEAFILNLNEPYTWSATLNDERNENYFKVYPKDGLASGSYKATVLITADNGISEEFVVEFKVY